MNPPAPQRHAVYFAPAATHPLWLAGCRWLGRDARAGHALTPPARHAVSTPWRYGFHATLKAPLRLAAGCSAADWRAAVQAVAARHQAFVMPSLEVAWLADFMALRPCAPVPASDPLRRLADDCVLTLDRWREAAPAASIRSAPPGGWSERQMQQLAQLGYAHVLEDWRFHITLSNAQAGGRDTTGECHAEDRHQRLFRAAQAHFADALAQPLHCDALCLFTESAPGAPLVLQHRLPLGIA
jgi:hypothetical protein